MDFAEEHCFGCVSALCDCLDEYGSSTAHKTFRDITSLDWKDLKRSGWRCHCSFTR